LSSRRLRKGVEVREIRYEVAKQRIVESGNPLTRPLATLSLKEREK
jgi:hypothetical protein